MSASKTYAIITRFALATTGAGGVHESWMAINGVLQNNGNSISSYFGPLGYNLSQFVHEMRTIALYNWMNRYDPANAWPLTANGAAHGFPSGDKCWGLWSRRSLCIKGGAAVRAGEPAVTLSSILPWALAA
jgi:hypothetical protein